MTAPTAPAPTAASEPEAPGTRELVRELESVLRLESRDDRFVKAQALLDEIRALADPRGADALDRALSRLGRPTRGDDVHWLSELAFALAELGDVRAVPALAHRLSVDPVTAYDVDDLRLKPMARTDQERIVAARYVAELAKLHPDAAATIRAAAEEAVYAWVTGTPSPHANGLRALAAMRSTRPDILRQVRDWAEPKVALPPVGAMPPFPWEFEVAQTALRYLGALRDPKSYPAFEKQLERRPRDFDASLDALMGGGTAMRGMAIRALAVGAAEGLSELGDHRAFGALLAHAEDVRANEQSRGAACSALVWIATDADAARIGRKVAASAAQRDKNAEFQLACWLSALAERSLPGLEGTLLALIAPSTSEETRIAAARALGSAGLGPTAAKQLHGLLGDSALQVAAALALMLGGSPSDAKAVADAFADPNAAGPRPALMDAYQLSLGRFTERDLESGRLQRWVDNALALASVRHDGQPQVWAKELLRGALGAALYDSGPHSTTRVALRYQLLQRAKTGKPEARAAARRVLELMGERGVLLALGAPR